NPAEATDGTTAAASDVIRIGVFEPLTGSNAGAGELELQGFKIANEMYPEVLGKKIELVVVDNKSDKAEAATAVARLIEKEKVVAILGSYGSSFCISAGDLIKTNKIPTVAATATNPMVTQGNDYYFRVCFLDPFQGTVMANYVYDTLGARTAGIIREASNDYSVGLINFFIEAFKERTGDENCIVAMADYNLGDQDFNSQITSVASKKPDVIFAPGNYTEGAMMISQARKQNIQIPFLGGDTWETDEFLQVGGADVEGASFTTFFDANDPQTQVAKDFIAKYNDKATGKELSSITALGHDAYLTVYKAIEAAGSTDPAAITEALKNIKDLEGAAGLITIGENGDAVKNSAVVKQVKDGKFQFVKTVVIDK
ncbi:MAG: ABC transporter substrate-binding protein, partial [Oscillospiraceae bacterium]